MLPTKPAVHVKLAKEVFKGQAEGPGPHDDLAEVTFAQGILQSQM